MSGACDRIKWLNGGVAGEGGGEGVRRDKGEQARASSMSITATVSANACPS